MKTVKLIGKGAFTRAYLMESGKVLIKTCDPIKECMAWGWFPESELFPKLDWVDLGVYEMEYYPRVKSLKGSLEPEQYEIYKSLRALGTLYRQNKHELHSAWHELFDTLEDEGLKEVMKEALDACGNYGSDISFEISPRNVAVKDGKLVLLDCFFSVSKLEEVRK
jgi:hypothetical protein